MIFFVVGATLKGSFYEGKVHSHALIAFPFDVYAHARFHKGVLNQQLVRIDPKTNTASFAKYTQGKLKELEKEEALSSLLESQIRNTYEVNPFPEPLRSFREEGVIYFGTFEHSDNQLYYGFAKDGLGIGWGILL